MGYSGGSQFMNGPPVIEARLKIGDDSFHSTFELALLLPSL